jgi:hypothetical protein
MARLDGALDREDADALGLTAIHVNRVLRHLREQKLLTLSKGSVKFHDLNRLRGLAGFQSGYLNSRDGAERHIPEEEAPRY